MTILELILKGAGVLAVFLLAVYFGIKHYRWERRRSQSLLVGETDLQTLFNKPDEPIETEPLISGKIQTLLDAAPNRKPESE